MQWTSALLLIGPIVLLVIALRRGRNEHRPASLRTIFIIYVAAAAAPLLFALLWRLDATRILIELHGVAFRGSQPIRKVVRESRGRISIGDKKAPQRFATLVFQQGAVSIELPPPADRAGLIGTTAGLAGALPLENHEVLCVDQRCWTYDEGARSFTSGKHVVVIPPRQAEIPGLDWTFTLPFAAPAPATLRTWSIDWIAHDGGAVSIDRRLRSFLCYSKRRLHFVPLDRDVTLRRGGSVVAGESAITVKNGERIAFYALPSDSAAFAAPGIAERRSMIVRTGRRSFALDLDTPEVHSLTVAELRALELAYEKGARTMNVALSMGDAQLVDRSLYFSGISESVAIEANAIFQLSRFFPRNLSSQFPIVSPRGPMTGTLGAVQWLGASDVAAIRFDVLRPPLLLLIAGAVLLLLKIASAVSARLTITQTLIAGAIELLVGIRLLLGYRVWSMPPHRLEAAELALVAWMMLPWIFLAASIPVDRLRAHFGDAWPALAGLLMSAIFVLRVAGGPQRWIWFACHFVALGVALLRTRAIPWRHVSIPIAASLFTVIRLLLLLGGFKESINLGARLSLSVLHIPAAVILQGYFLWRTWQRVRANGRLETRDHLAALSIFLFVWCIPAALTSDIGLALLNVPLFALLYLGLARHAPSPRGRAIPYAVAALVALFIAGAPLLRLALPFIRNEEFLLGFASDSNYARFLHFAAPERLQALATKRGESLAITSAILQSYISSGIFGRGYGHSDVSPHLGDTALRDFAPAVFVAAEWGLIGTLAVLLLYLLFAVAAHPWLPWHDSSAESVIAFVAAATITVSSCYMILANHELLLLTGKNAYLLGLDSAGDVIETLALLLLIAYGAAVARGETGGAFGGGSA
jgi:cell division protein FtsW (lipid II flippase)